MLTQIKEKTLVEYTDEFRINGTGILLGDIKSKIKETVEKYGARCNIDIAEIVSGGWMSSRSTRHCITITHPRYWGCYFGFCITTREYGNFTIVNIYNFGKSDQLKAEAVLQQKTFTGATAGGIAAGVLRGGATGAGFAVGSLVAGTVRGGAKLIGKGFAALTADKAALAEEKDWYGLIGMVLQDAFLEIEKRDGGKVAPDKKTS